MMGGAGLDTHPLWKREIDVLVVTCGGHYKTG